jgi:peroxiredoxin Q/BCP
MKQLKEGDKAPAFEGINQDGKTIRLSDLKGKKVILYFYPKDFTSGCTDEACSLRDNYAELAERGFEVIGVSPDNEKSHIKFKSKYELPYNLISDTEKNILKDYGAWGEKNMYGKIVQGVLRTTFIINEEGVIEKVFTKVNTKDHAQQILEGLGEN